MRALKGRCHSRKQRRLSFEAKLGPKKTRSARKKQRRIRDTERPFAFPGRRTAKKMFSLHVVVSSIARAITKEGRHCGRQGFLLPILSHRLIQQRFCTYVRCADGSHWVAAGACSRTTILYYICTDGLFLSPPPYCIRRTSEMAHWSRDKDGSPSMWWGREPNGSRDRFLACVETAAEIGLLSFCVLCGPVLGTGDLCCLRVESRVTGAITLISVVAEMESETEVKTGLSGLVLIQKGADGQRRGIEVEFFARRYRSCWTTLQIGVCFSRSPRSACAGMCYLGCIVLLWYVTARCQEGACTVN